MNNWDLYKLRLISFGWSVLSLVTTVVVGALASPEFATIVTQHFGTGAVSMLVLMGVTELVKHVRNVRVLNTAGRVGGAARQSLVTLI